MHFFGTAEDIPVICPRRLRNEGLGMNCSELVILPCGHVMEQLVLDYEHSLELLITGDLNSLIYHMHALMLGLAATLGLLAPL